MKNNIDFELDLNIKCKSHPDDPTVIISEMDGGIKGNTNKESLTIALAFIVGKVLDICNQYDLLMDDVLDKTDEILNNVNITNVKESSTDPLNYPINIDPKNLNA